MEAVTNNNRIKDDAKELAAEPSDDGGTGLGGGSPEQQDGTTTASTGAPAATETGGSKSDKEGDMPETNSGNGSGGLGGSGSGQATTYVEFPRGDDYVPVYYLNQGTAPINYQAKDDIVLKGIYWQTSSDQIKIANATFESEDDPTLTKGFQRGVLR